MIYRFGLFEFDPAAGELRKQGRLVRIEPQPARALALLVSRPAEVVTREQLRARVWEPGTHVDYDRGLAYCLGQVRTALGDSADNPRFVETLPRRGYRFIAPVTCDPPSLGDSGELRRASPENLPALGDGGELRRASPESLPSLGDSGELRRASPESLPSLGDSGELRRASPAHTEPGTARLEPGTVHREPGTNREPGTENSEPRSFRRSVALVLLALLVGVGVAWSWARMMPSRPRIAVAIFDNETGRGEFDRLAGTAADVMVERLTALGTQRIGVIGNTPALRVSRGQRDPAAVLRETGAGFFVIGQVQDDDAGVRLVVHLIRLDDDTHLWVTRVARAPADLADIQDVAADRLAEAVRRHVIERDPDAPRFTR